LLRDIVSTSAISTPQRKRALHLGISGAARPFLSRG
jgi:hypothetical protein